MISLKKSIADIEDNERRFETALACYLAAITSMERHAVPVQEDLVYRHRTELKSLRRKIKEEPVTRILEQARQALDRELGAHCDKARQVLEQKGEEVRRIIRTLAEATATLTAHNEEHSGHLNSFTRQLETIARIDDLSQIRRKLSQEVTALKSYVVAIRKDNQTSVDRLRDEVRWFQQRLEKAEALASTDRLTGVANRAEGERRLE